MSENLHLHVMNLRREYRSNSIKVVSNLAYILPCVLRIACKLHFFIWFSFFKKPCILSNPCWKPWWALVSSSVFFSFFSFKDVFFSFCLLKQYISWSLSFPVCFSEDHSHIFISRKNYSTFFFFLQYFFCVRNGLGLQIQVYLLFNTFKYQKSISALCLFNFFFLLYLLWTSSIT